MLNSNKNKIRVNCHFTRTTVGNPDYIMHNIITKYTTISIGVHNNGGSIVLNISHTFPVFERGKKKKY